MYYLSKMELNGRRRQTATFLNNPHTMHAAIESLFPSPGEVRNPRSLWRLERVGNSVNLWLMSNRIPSFEHLQESAGWSNATTWITKDYSTLLDRLMKGQRYRFRLTANTSKEVFCADNKKRRVALFREDHQIEWLLQRAEAIGISLVDADGQPTFKVSHSRERKFTRNSKTVTLYECTFDGVLEVTDPELLRHALVNGIGRGKAYGLGLLTLST